MDLIRSLFKSTPAPQQAAQVQDGVTLEEETQVGASQLGTVNVEQVVQKARPFFEGAARSEFASIFKYASKKYARLYGKEARTFAKDPKSLEAKVEKVIIFIAPRMIFFGTFLLSNATFLWKCITTTLFGVALLLTAGKVKGIVSAFEDEAGGLVANIVLLFVSLGCIIKPEWSVEISAQISEAARQYKLKAKK